MSRCDDIIRQELMTTLALLHIERVSRVSSMSLDCDSS